jgi:hypothetical protein
MSDLSHITDDRASSPSATAGAKEAAQQVASEVASQASAVVGQTKEQVHQFVGQARNELGSQIETSGRQAVDRLHVVGQQLEALAGGRPDEAGPLIGYVQEGQARVDALAERLQQGGLQGVAEDLATFARRRPGTFLVAAGLAGLVVGRLVAASTSAVREGLVDDKAERVTADAEEVTSGAGPYVEPPNSTVDDWHGQEVQRDIEAAEQALAEAPDAAAAERRFEEIRPEHTSERYKVPEAERPQ